MVAPVVLSVRTHIYAKDIDCDVKTQKNITQQYGNICSLTQERGMPYTQQHHDINLKQSKPRNHLVNMFGLHGKRQSSEKNTIPGNLFVTS